MRAPWPDWIEWKPGRVWCYDFTHFTRARRVALAVMDVVSRRWLCTLVSAEETATQIETAFLAALDEEQLSERIDTRLLAALRAGTATPAELDGPEADGVPVLIAMSDNGPQMRSHSTKEFTAASAIMQRFGRPGTPTDQAWIESLFGHVKGDWPHLEKIRDAGELTAELDRVRVEYNTVRLHAGIGYVTPDDEHHGRRRGHPPGPPRRPRRRPPGPHRIPSNEHKEPIMIARRSWQGIFSAHDRIKSETPQARSGRPQGS